MLQKRLAVALRGEVSTAKVVYHRRSMMFFPLETSCLCLCSQPLAQSLTCYSVDQLSEAASRWRFKAGLIFSEASKT